MGPSVKDSYSTRLAGGNLCDLMSMSFCVDDVSRQCGFALATLMRHAVVQVCFICDWHVRRTGGMRPRRVTFQLLPQCVAHQDGRVAGETSFHKWCVRLNVLIVSSAS
eukprot:2402608-Amphidinium_carterae.1